MLRGANKNLPVRNRGRAEYILIQRILSQHFKLWPSGNDRRQSVFISNINLPIREHGRAAISSRLDALLRVDFCASLRIETEHDPAIVNDIKILAIRDGRRNIRAVGGGPKHV